MRADQAGCLQRRGKARPFGTAAKMNCRVSSDSHFMRKTTTATGSHRQTLTREQERLLEHRQGKRNWKKWGPYVSDRAWGTVREDYSSDGSAWTFLTHDMARSKAYRWGEDAIAGICDDRQILCFSVAMWNENDPILKERFFGLTGVEGNHGEDVKEL